MADARRCDYQIAGTRQCQNLAKWTVAYITPDDGTMRHHAEAQRCYWHTDNRFFPPGTTGITTRGFARSEETDHAGR